MSSRFLAEQFPAAPLPRFNPLMDEIPLAGLISDIDERPDDRRNASLVRSLNTMIGRYSCTLRQMINDIAARGNRIRTFEFPHITTLLAAGNTPNHIDP